MDKKKTFDRSTSIRYYKYLNSIRTNSCEIFATRFGRFQNRIVLEEEEEGRRYSNVPQNVIRNSLFITTNSFYRGGVDRATTLHFVIRTISSLPVSYQYIIDTLPRAPCAIILGGIVHGTVSQPAPREHETIRDDVVRLRFLICARTTVVTTIPGHKTRAAIVTAHRFHTVHIGTVIKKKSFLKNNDCWCDNFGGTRYCTELGNGQDCRESRS